LVVWLVLLLRHVVRRHEGLGLVALVGVGSAGGFDGWSLAVGEVIIVLLVAIGRGLVLVGGVPTVADRICLAARECIWLL